MGVKLSKPGAPDTFIYMPTNNCARVMNFIKLNELDDVVVVKSPADYGGLKSEKYLEINPMGKMPALVTADGETVFESQVILEYLVDKHASRCKVAPWPSTLAGRTKARLLMRVHDMYVSGPNCTADGSGGSFSNQGCFYKPGMTIAERKARITDMAKQLDVIEGLLDDAGPYAAGDQICLADCVLYPTIIFVVELAPIGIGWTEPLATRPKMAKWFALMESHPILSKVPRPTARYPTGFLDLMPRSPALLTLVPHP